MNLARITFDSKILAGRTSIRGMRISVAHVINLVADGLTPEEIIADHPDLEAEDIRQALQYAALVAKEETHPYPAA